MAQLLEALEADFKGFPEIEKKCKEAPKYGNDSPWLIKLPVRSLLISLMKLKNIKQIWQNDTRVFYPFPATRPLALRWAPAFRTQSLAAAG
jgi:ATP-dependent helicase YprA (DUF1998 family)